MGSLWAGRRGSGGRAGHRVDRSYRPEQYAAAGVELTAAPRVGLGSVCRWQHTDQICRIVVQLAAIGLRLHGFGVKGQLVSADSLAWSSQARMKGLRLPGCAHGKAGTGNCANCTRYALSWRADLLEELAA